MGLNIYTYIHVLSCRPLILNPKTVNLEVEMKAAQKELKATKCSQDAHSSGACSQTPASRVQGTHSLCSPDKPNGK